MLKFNEEKHEYTLDGKKLISVTQLMQKHGLSPDYSNVDKTVLRAKAERGTLIHKEIENYIKTGELGWSQEVIEFKNYVEEHKLNNFESETMVHNDIVAGTIDLVFDRDDDDWKTDWYIADIKTTYSLHTEAVSWQLSIYLWLYLGYDERFPDVNWDGYKAQVFHFDRDGNLKVVDIPLKPIEEVDQLFCCERTGEIYQKEFGNEIIVKQIFDLEKTIKYHENILKEAKEKEEEMRNALLEAMENNAIKTFENESIRITYVAPTTRSTIDSVRLKKELPDIAEKYSKVSNVKATLKITLKGNENE